MATFTLTIQGDPAEFREALQLILAAGGAVTLGQEATSQSDDPTSGPSSWTPEEFAHFWKTITSDARAILQELAKRPDGYTFHELQEAVGLDGLKVAGRLSSVGHAMNQFQGKREPVTRDYRTRHYFMDPEVASLINQSAS